MENFTEFDNLSTTPQKDSSSVIAHAFTIYKKGLPYAILMIVIVSILSYLLSLVSQAISGFDPLAASEEMRENGTHYMGLLSMPGYPAFLGVTSFLGLVLYPFNAGLLYIFNKINFNQKVEVADLFIGYKQNTAQLLLYGLLSNIILLIAFSLCFLPGIFVAPLLLFGLPIVFFENLSAVDALKKSYEMAKENYWTVVGIAILSFFISISGIILCCIGIFVTAPFLYAGVYSAYCAYFGAPKAISTN